MIATFETSHLKAALATVGQAISAKSHIPIMSSVKLISDGETAVLTGTGMDITVETKCIASGEAVSACLPYDTLSAFVKNAKAGSTVSITIDGSDAKVSSGRSRITLSALPADDFPASAKVATGNDIPAQDIAAALSYCMPAASKDETRYFLKGVNIDHDDAGTYAWGTNGNVVHRYEMGRIVDLGSAIIPTEACHVIVSVIGDADTAIMSLSQASWSIECGATKATGKVIDATYPDIRRAVGQFKDWRDICDVYEAELKSAITTASIGAQTDAQRVRSIILIAKDGVLSVRGHRTAGGVLSAGRDDVDVGTCEDMAIGVNSDFLLNAINGAGRVNIQFCDNGGGAIRVAQNGSSAFAVIMGYRIAQQDLSDE